MFLVELLICARGAMHNADFVAAVPQVILDGVSTMAVVVVVVA
jgi:hypothetical protein